MAQKLMARAWIILAVLLMLSCTTAAAAAANTLTIVKNVSPSQVYTGEPVTWTINLTNNAPDPVKVEITDTIVSEFGDVDFESVYASNSCSAGMFSANTGVWTIDNIETGRMVSLTLVTKFAEAGTYTNWANITESSISDSDGSDNNASDKVIVLAPVDLTGKIIIKPESLNLKSKGAFTVFVNITGDYDTSEIDLDNCNLTCNGAEAYSLKIAGAGDEDGAFGKIIAKFNRQDLVDVSAGSEVPIVCSGYIQVGSEQIKVQGSDTLRVMNDLRTESFFDKLLRFFGLTGDDTVTTGESTFTLPTLPADITNFGQAKKYVNSVQQNSDDDQDTGTDENVVETTPPVKEKLKIQESQNECRGNSCGNLTVKDTIAQKNGNGKGQGKTDEE